MNKQIPILIIGAGSIGERHIRNLWSLGYRNLIVYRQRNLPFRDIANASVKVLLSWDLVLELKPFAAFICTPSSQHLQQAMQCLQNEMHVFVEKPLSHTVSQMEALKELASQKNKLLQVGFMMRFHPHILAVKKLIDENTFGTLLTISSHWGSYLPDWHTWEDYKVSYAANKILGGGVALTLCHDLDLALWMNTSTLMDYTASFAYDLDLAIDAEAVANFALQFENGSKANIHLNYLDKPPIRTYTWDFTHAAITFNYFENTLIIESKLNAQKTETIQLENFDRNNLFIDEVKGFFSNLESIQNKSTYSLNQIKESECIITMCNASN